MKILFSILLALSTFAASAQTNTTPKPVDEWVKASVVKVDTKRNKLTLQHERIASISMDAMTMPFHVHEKSKLAELKQGDKLLVQVKDVAGDLTVMQWKRVP